MKTTCKRCGHKWDYKGKAIWITCPSCRSLMKNPINCKDCSFCEISDGTEMCGAESDVSSDGTYYDCNHPEMEQPNHKNPGAGRSCDEYVSLMKKCPLMKVTDNAKRK